MRIAHQILSFNFFVYALTFLVLSSCSTTDSVKSDSGTDTQQIVDDPGMWLLSQINDDLYSKMDRHGFTLPQDSIYDTDNPSLNQAIVRVNINGNLGGTGSFVSPQGLILTNKNVAYNALSSASSTNKNYLTEGFYADSIENEIPIPGYSIYITIEQKEVTDQIKSQLADSLTYREQLQQSQKIREQLIKERKGNNQNIVVEINDFWGANRQYLSVYKIIRDVRLVHTPPKSIANLNDKKWPRHSADYAFLRAYVGPNGKGRTYHSENVPFRPAKHLNMSTAGIAEKDFTLVMGYPGQTSRHESSYALKFYHNQRNPVIIESYQAILDGLEYAAARDSQKAIATASQRSSLQSTISYYREIQQGIEKQDIIQHKQEREEGFKEWIKQDSIRRVRYRRVLNQLDQAYTIAGQTGDLLHATVYALNNSRLLQIASLYNSHWGFLEDSTQQKIDQSYKDSLLARHKALLDDINIEAQQITLAQMLKVLTTLPEGKVMLHLLELFGDAEGEELKTEIENYLQTQRQQSIIYDLERAQNFLSLPIDSARKKPIDDFVKLYRAIIESYQFSRKNYVQYIAYQKPAQERFVRGMTEYNPDSFRYPDANGTLRLSTGRIKGYHPQDGVYYTPFTTLGGLKEKVPYSFDSTHTTSDNSLVINFLSTNDVTGGNSGSPVLNENSELVGITFDLNSHGTASDYKYNADLSRTISVSTQYILFLMDHLNTDRLKKEMELPE